MVGDRVLKISGLFWVALLTMTVVAEAVPGVKVRVRAEGFYRVTKAELAAIWGVSDAQVTATSLKVSNMGRDVSCLRDGGDVVFYGHAFDSVYTDLNAYWIEEGTPVAPVQQGAGATWEPYVPSFTFTQRIEQDSSMAVGATFINDMEAGYADPIFWKAVEPTKFLPFWMYLTNVVSAQASIKVRLCGMVDGTHQAGLRVSGVPYPPSFTFDGKGIAENVWNLPAGALSTSDRTSCFIDNLHASSPFYLDYVDVTYQRSFVSVSNALRFAGVDGSVEVSGLSTENVRVWDVTDPWRPVLLTGSVESSPAGGWRALIQADADRVYAVAPVGQESAPLEYRLGSDKNLRAATWEVDHLSIAAPDLVGASESLTAYRNQHGLRAALISVEDVYDNFNYGIRDALAIRNFLAYARRNWSVAPRYVFLVGDGSLDYKNRLGYNDSLIPAIPLVFFDGGAYASDYLLGDFEGTGDVHMAVGRLAVKTPLEVSNYVQKVVSYEAQAGSAWRENALLVADKNDAPLNFTNDVGVLETKVKKTTKKVVKVGDDASSGEVALSEARSQVVQGINDGAELSIYAGHSTLNTLGLTGQAVFDSDSVTQLQNSAKPTAMILLGCLSGNFATPGGNSIGESMVNRPDGAVVLIGAGTKIYPSDAVLLVSTMLDTAYQEQDAPARLGDSWIAGKQTIAGSFVDAYKAYQFHGDPGIAFGSNRDASRSGDQVGPSMPSLAEWTSWQVAPALASRGEEMDLEADDDGDGQNNYQEFAAGTDPLDRASSLRITSLDRLNVSHVQVSWPSAIQRVYRLQRSSSVTGPYADVSSDLTATPPFNNQQVTQDQSAVMFYRVVLQ